MFENQTQSLQGQHWKSKSRQATGGSESKVRWKVMRTLLVPNKAHAAYSKWMRDVELMWLCVWIHACEGCMCTLWKLGVNPEYCCSDIVFWDRSLTGDDQFCQAVWVVCFRDLPALYSPALRLQMHMPTPAFLHGAWGLVLTLAQGALCQLLSPCGWFQVMNWLNKIG